MKNICLQAPHAYKSLQVLLFEVDDIIIRCDKNKTAIFRSNYK